MMKWNDITEIGRKVFVVHDELAKILPAANGSAGELPKNFQGDPINYLIGPSSRSRRTDPRERRC